MSSRLCQAFPLPEMVAVGTVGLLIGIAIGYVLGRASRTHPGVAMSTPLPDRARNFYERWQYLIVIVLFVIAASGVWVGSTATIVNGRQDSERAQENEVRDKQTAALLKCFDQYAQAASTSSSAVRAAQVKVDEATGIRDDALAAEGDAFQMVVEKILAHTMTADDFKHLRDTLAERSRNSRILDAAQNELDQARRDNPVPPAPSTFCDASPADASPAK